MVRERVDIATNLDSAIAAFLKVMLVCGSDLLESFSTPGAWIPEQVNLISIISLLRTVYAAHQGCVWMCVLKVTIVP